ncbi:MAG TPA: hypothetical protein VLC53_06510 [Myxococcota bacterium]|jgi:uncharacterized membrane protein|nr:hypothetical protein [Myxococcota bacterium]
MTNAPVPAAEARLAEPPSSALTVAKIVYGLHGFAILVGIAGSATVIGSFVGSVPSIVAVILNYLKRRDARGTWLESHYRWQIRTFWFAIGWVILAAILFVTLIGIPISFAILIGVTIWLVYRIGKGWLRLLDRRPMYE